MGIGRIVSQYGLPLGTTALALLLLFSLFATLARRGKVRGLWRGVASHPIITGLLAVALLVLVGFLTYMQGKEALEQFRHREARDLASNSNLFANPLFTASTVTNTYPASWVITGTVSTSGSGETGAEWQVALDPQAAIGSNVIPVRPMATYQYSLYALVEGDDRSYAPGQVRMRLLWLNRALSPVTWLDFDLEAVGGGPDAPYGFRSATITSPDGAAFLQVELRNMGNNKVAVFRPKLSQQGIYVEQHPNGAQGSLAFSFDWESAMGGAIHSKGMAQHDANSAAQHGSDMRQGANWLNSLFLSRGIRATFYATGYNLLDGNTERRLFSGDPTYQWAKSKNGWASDYWLTHKWYGDDPYATYRTEPAWYFGDQTRDLLRAGHEIGSHTFGHLYVRGAKSQELAADMDEWLAAAKAANVPLPTTFAFPWRSSNSLTPDFYDVLYKHGIRAVTRLYERDLKDLYTVSAVPTYTGMLIMPDFLLGAPSANTGEEAAGNVIGLEKGLQVIQETLARRGTTSFWTHPEQLASQPGLESVRKAWEGVVSAAAMERDKGRLWVAPVADIIAYQTGIMSVTASLEQGFLGIGGWKVQVHNDSGKELAGVTLTMPGDVVKASSAEADVLTVYHTGPGDAQRTQVSAPGKPVYPARQLVLSKLKPGVTTIEVEWAADQKPLP